MIMADESMWPKNNRKSVTPEKNREEGCTEKHDKESDDHQ